MLSVAPDARRFSPSQNIRVKSWFPTLSVMYVTDRDPETGRTTPTDGLLQGQQRSAVMLHTHQGYARERVRVPDELCARPGFASTAVYFERLAQKEVRADDLIHPH